MSEPVKVIDLYPRREFPTGRKVFKQARPMPTWAGPAILFAVALVTSTLAWVIP